MNRPRSRPSVRAHRSDMAFLGILGGVLAAALIGCLVWLAMRGNTGPKPLDVLTLEWTVAPVWQTPPQSGSGLPPEAAGGLDVYLDVSEPMQGFLPPPSAPGETSGFRSLVSQIPDHLVSVAGGTSTPVQWFGVASVADQPLARPQPLTRGYFKGGESRIDLALRRMIDRLQRGDTQLAALVSDLIATEELVGAMGAAKALSDWGRSDGVRSGEFGVGLLAVRGSYWGVYKECGPGEGAGCWFSEQAGQYRRLSRVIQRPFYILVLGRDVENVDATGKALAEAASKLGMEPHWELLSESARPKPVKVECMALKADDDREQYALFRSENGTFTCRRAETVRLLCSWPSGRFEGDPTIKASWDGLHTELTKEGKVLIALDCGKLQAAMPDRDLVVEVEGAPSAVKGDVWEKWTAETDEVEADLDRTLRLDKFVEKVRLRSERIRMTSPPLLKVKNS